MSLDHLDKPTLSPTAGRSLRAPRASVSPSSPTPADDELPRRASARSGARKLARRPAPSHACQTCAVGKRACDGGRPCLRCVRLGRGDLCRDAEAGASRAYLRQPSSGSRGAFDDEDERDGERRSAHLVAAPEDFVVAAHSPRSRALAWAPSDTRRALVAADAPSRKRIRDSMDVLGDRLPFGEDLEWNVGALRALPPLPELPALAVAVAVAVAETETASTAVVPPPVAAGPFKAPLGGAGGSPAPLGVAPVGGSPAHAAVPAPETKRARGGLSPFALDEPVSATLPRVASLGLLVPAAPVAAPSAAPLSLLPPSFGSWGLGASFPLGYAEEFGATVAAPTLAASTSFGAGLPSLSAVAIPPHVVAHGAPSPATESVAPSSPCASVSTAEQEEEDDFFRADAAAGPFFGLDVDVAAGSVSEDGSLSGSVSPFDLGVDGIAGQEGGGGLGCLADPAFFAAVSDLDFDL